MTTRALEPVPNGSLPAGTRLQVYRNLHLSGRAWSLRDPRTGRVVAHSADVVVLDARLVVQPGGQARARREQQRNVHAYVVGELAATEVGTQLRTGTSWRAATYRPYADDSFVDVETGAAVSVAAAAWLGSHGLRYLPS